MTVGTPADDKDTRPSGLPEESSRKQRVGGDTDRVSLRPPTEATGDSPDTDSAEPAPHAEGEAGEVTPAPPGLRQMSPSARLRLELALEHDSDEVDLDDAETPAIPKRPLGLKNMSTSARHRLELALEHDDEDVFDPNEPPVLAREQVSEFGVIAFDDKGRQVIASLSRWIGFCGVMTLGIGALTGLSYLTGEGSVAHVVVGILATAIAVWQLMAVLSLRRVLSKRQQQHHMVHALGYIRSALLLKALLVCATMILGCFAFSIAGSLLFLLG